MSNYNNSSKTPSVFSASEDEDDQSSSVLFSHSTTLTEYHLTSPQRRTSSMSNEQAKAIIFSTYNENRKLLQNSHNHNHSHSPHNHNNHHSHQNHSQLHSIASEISNSAETNYSSISPPEPKLFYIRLSTDDETFKTILKKEEHTTVGEIIQILQRKYYKGEHIMISLEEGDNVAKHLNHHDKIVKLQNRLLRINGVDEEDLPKACLGKDNSFKFLIHRV